VCDSCVTWWFVSAVGVVMQMVFVFSMVGEGSGDAVGLSKLRMYTHHDCLSLCVDLLEVHMLLLPFNYLSL